MRGFAPGVRRSYIATDCARAVEEFDSGDFPVGAEESAQDVAQIRHAAAGVEEHQTEVVAVEGRAGSEFAQHSSKIADANCE